jgi:gluconolactonase
MSADRTQMTDDPVASQPWRPESIPRRVLHDVTVLADDLQFPEGPVAMRDGSVLLVEVDRGTVTRVDADGRVEVVAECEGAPNGAAIGPDGALYLCNNGGRFARGTWDGGWIDRLDLGSGRVERLYTHHDGRRLSGPNDLVFDPSGGFWFTDTGKLRGRERDVGSLYYATIDGGRLVEAAHPVESPNGIGLSPDGRTLYYAETGTGRLRRRSITGAGQPGQLEPTGAHDPETLVCGLPGDQLFDSLAVDSRGNVCVGTLLTGCITVASADGLSVGQWFLPPDLEDRLPTNICFGGPDLRTAYITLAGTGRLVACPWPVAGLALAFDA